MRRMRPLVALSIAVAVLAGCGKDDGSRVQGYIEGEYVRIAAPAAGELLKLSVQRGDTVAQGAALFQLDPEPQQQGVADAQARVQMATTQLKRAEELRSKGWMSNEQLDAARTERDRAGPQLAQAQWLLGQKTVDAPAAGLVEDTYYRVGEWVPAGAPVVSLLPPENRIVRFFVPEPRLAALKVGQSVQVHVDGAALAVSAKVSYIAPRAEFTPPVIYSREARAKLVFLVEARPAAADALALHPGQPVDVEPLP